MRLRLNIEDVDVQLKISRWRKRTTPASCDDNWTMTELFLQSNYLKYNINGEILTSDEVEDLIHTLSQFLSGELSQQYSVEFIEPDLEFTLYSAEKEVDIDMDFIIHFWANGALSSNRFSMTFGFKEIEALFIYLQTVTGALNSNDTSVQQLMCMGILLPE